jgi:large subunit ribosomal protein L18
MLRKIKDKATLVKLRRKDRVRYKLKKLNKDKPRLSIFISNLHIYAQVIDDVKSITVASASTIDKELKKSLKKTSNKEAAEVVGKAVAERLLSKGISEVVFDRGSHIFHGRIKSLADKARETGLKF